MNGPESSSEVLAGCMLLQDTPP